MHRMRILPLLLALCLSACGSKVVTIPGPEVVRLAPAKIDPRLLACMDVSDPKDPSEVKDGTPSAIIVGIIGVEAERYKLAWKSCRDNLAAIAASQNVTP